MRTIPLALIVLCGSLSRICTQTNAAPRPRPQTDKHEKMPLPEKVVAARTVFLINETEENKRARKDVANVEFDCKVTAVRYSSEIEIAGAEHAGPIRAVAS